MTSISQFVANQVWSFASQKQSLSRVLGLGVMRIPWKITRTCDSLVAASIYGSSLTLRASHPLPLILINHPYFGLPLLWLAQCLNKSELRVIDVGANIGDTAALLSRTPNLYSHILCLEPDPEFFALCCKNVSHLQGVTVMQAAVAEHPGSAGHIDRQHAGTASLSVDQSGPSGIRCAPLGTLAEEFLNQVGGLDLLKIDTDGYDLTVLRSAKDVLVRFKPAVMFEWHPALWSLANNNPLDVFETLGSVGYEHFVLFENSGKYHGELYRPSRDQALQLQTRCLERRLKDDLHFDIVAASDVVCQRLVELSKKELGNLASHS